MKKVKVFSVMALLVGAFLLAPGLTFAQANPCAAKNPCAAQNPCAAKNPCAVKTDKKAGKGTKETAAKAKKEAANPCAANPCAVKK